MRNNFDLGTVFGGGGEGSTTCFMFSFDEYLNCKVVAILSGTMYFAAHFYLYSLVKSSAYYATQ